MSKAPQSQHHPGDDCAFVDVCPLNDVAPGQCVRIKRLEASPEDSHRLREMGFCEEQQVRVVRQDDAVICQVCQARLGLSPELARRIMVQPVAGRSQPGTKAA